MKKIYGLLFLIMMFCVGCEWQLKPNSAEDEVQVTIERYDRIESLYLTTGDYSALQQMNANYPMQTRMLIENVLRIGKVDDAEINTRLLKFFKDSTLQRMLVDVGRQYGDMDDVNEELSEAFGRLKEEMPSVEIPQCYAQVGSFDQSIIVGYNTLGISLDKYLGSEYPFYQQHYDERQRSLMTRDMIVPDCMSFYLLSLFPLPNLQESPLEQRNEHMGRIQYVVNSLVHRQVFNNPYVEKAEKQYKADKHQTLQQFLTVTL